MSAQKPIALMKFGSPEPSAIELVGDFPSWFARALGPKVQTLLVDLEATRATLPEEALGVILMGSLSSIYVDHYWLQRAEPIVKLAQARCLPILGVCFGHQILAELFGGEVQANPKGFELGTRWIQATAAGQSDRILGPLLDARGRLLVNLSHGDSVVRAPRSATVLATSDRDECQALRYDERCFSVQFHPEMGAAEIRTAFAAHADKARLAGDDPNQLQALDTPVAVQILTRFAESLEA